MAEAAATDAVEPSLAGDAAAAEEEGRRRAAGELVRRRWRGAARRSAATAALRAREAARECGYTRGLGNIASVGYDAPASMLSAADARRLIKFLPENLEAHAFDAAEFKGRIRAANESVPPTAAREAQARLESVFRHAVNEATLRTVEAGRMRVTAATMHGVLRPYVANMRFTAVLPPKGWWRRRSSPRCSATRGLDADADVTADAAFQKRWRSCRPGRRERPPEDGGDGRGGEDARCDRPAKEKKGKKPKKAAARCCAISVDPRVREGDARGPAAERSEGRADRGGAHAGVRDSETANR